MVAAQVEARGGPRYRVVGESALSVEFAPQIATEVNRQVQALLAALDAAAIPGILDLIPAYRSLLIQYDPQQLTHTSLIERLRALAATVADGSAAVRTVTIPVVYGGAFGPDLEAVATHTGLTVTEVIARHAAGHYTVYFLGFAPGFPYLGGLDPALATPRLSPPRMAVPAGAVGIGGEQTGIYSLPTPGGWRIIGRTPVRLYEPTGAEPFLLRAGDRLRFQPITEEEFATAAATVAAGSDLLAGGLESGVVS